MSAKTLKAREVCKAYKGRTVVSSVDIDVHMGEIVGLLGPNGAGKTTTFYMIVGLIKPDSGRVMIDEKDITSLPMYRRARIGVGYLPQEASVFRNLSVQENIELVLQELGRPKKEIEKMVEHILDELGLTDLADVPGYALSGGERRRVEIARCLSIMRINI